MTKRKMTKIFKNSSVVLILIQSWLNSGFAQSELSNIREKNVVVYLNILDTNANFGEYNFRICDGSEIVYCADAEFSNDTTIGGRKYIYHELVLNCITIFRQQQFDDTVISERMELWFNLSDTTRDIQLFVDSLVFDGFAVLNATLGLTGKISAKLVEYSGFNLKTRPYKSKDKYRLSVDAASREFMSANYALAIRYYYVALELEPEQLWIHKQIKLCQELMSY